MTQFKAKLASSRKLLIVLVLWIVMVQKLLKAQLSSLTLKFSGFSVFLSVQCADATVGSDCDNKQWTLGVKSLGDPGAFLFCMQRSQRTESVFYLLCLKIFEHKVCTGFFFMQCHWLQHRNWFRAQYIPAELWGRRLFPLQLSLFIVFKSWQVSPQQSSCLAKNVGRPLLCQSFPQNLLVILITETGRRVWTAIPAGISVIQNTVCNKQHLVSDLQQCTPLKNKCLFHKV